jgi:hypothetical protein
MQRRKFWGMSPLTNGHAIVDRAERMRRADESLGESIVACIELARAKAELAGTRGVPGPGDTAMDLLKESVQRYAIREREADETADSVIARLTRVLATAHRTGDYSFTLRTAASGWCVQAYFESPALSAQEPRERSGSVSRTEAFEPLG